jgi:hypothetical protein
VHCQPLREIADGGLWSGVCDDAPQRPERRHGYNIRMLP